MSNYALPPLESPYDLAPEVLGHYQEAGWALVRHLAKPDEIHLWGEKIRAVALKHNLETRPMHERDTYGKAFLQIMNLWQLDPAIHPYTLSKRFAGVAAALLGVGKVRLYHDQALFKEPGGGHTPWHQDGYFWPVDQAKTITMWMPLVDVDADMGSMSFADGSQNAGLISLEEGISDSSEAFYQDYVNQHGYPVRTSGAMRAGDATFHSGLTLHKAPGNPTDRVRAVMTIIYVAGGEIVREPLNPNQEVDLRTWFPGLKPGDPIGSPLNPLI